MKSQTTFLKSVSFRKNGFVLPFTMVISTLILFVMLSSMTLLSKQLYFSKLYKQSQAAYYSADDAIACAIVIDDTYSDASGLGIFPSSMPTLLTHEDGSTSYDYIDNVVAYVKAQRDAAGLASVDEAKDIVCGQSIMFDTDPDSSSKFTVSSTPYIYNYEDPITHLPATETGVTSTFSMKMDLGENTLTGLHSYRCANLTVNKTESFRQIIAQGYSSCDTQNGAIERSVVNTTITE